MKHSDFIRRTEMVLEAAKMLPDDLEPCNIWINEYVRASDKSFPQITVYESIETRPNGFYAFADAIGKTARRAPHGDDRDALMVDLENGVQIYMVVEKLEAPDESA